MSRDYFQRRCEILEAIIDEYDPSLLPPRGAPHQERFFKAYMKRTTAGNVEITGPETFCTSFIKEVTENSTRQPQGRRWSLTTLRFAFVLRSLGSKTYEYLRWFVPLPCKQTLLSHFRDSMSTWSRCLLDTKDLPDVCRLFRKRHSLAEDEPVQVCLGIDAMSMEPVAVGDLVCNHVFLFELLPLSGRMKPMSIHLMPWSSGNANSDVLKRIEDLVAELNVLKFPVQFIATDGDRGYDSWHQQMHLKWQTLYYKHGLEKVIEQLDQTEKLIVGDLLHLLKNARSKLLKGKVSVFGDGSFAFDARDLEQELNLGRALTDCSSKGKMRDIYVLEIFTLENAVTLIQRRQLAMSLYIVPYAMWVSVVMNPAMSCQMRREFLSFVINLFAEMLLLIRSVDTKQVAINKNEPGKVQFAFFENHMKRVLNTLVVQLYEIQRRPDDLAMDRIGTHVLECRFGMIRLLCQYKHSWKMILRSFSKSLLLEDLTLILGHDIRINSRVNVAGTKITSDSKTIYIVFPDISPRQLWESTFMFMLQESSDAGHQLPPDVCEFKHFFQHFLDTCVDEEVPTLPRMWHGSSVSNATIVARLIEFCHTTSTDEDGTNHDSQRFSDGDNAEKLLTMLNVMETPESARNA